MAKRFLESSCNFQESKLTKREFEPVLIQNYLDGNGMFKWKDFESMGTLLEPPGRRKYKLLEEIGVGGWAVVVRAWDRENSAYVAVKIASHEASSKNFSKTEIEILEDVKRYNFNERMIPNIPNCCILLRTSFIFNQLSCLVFDDYGLDLFSILKKNKYQPMDIRYIKAIAFQLFGSLYRINNLHSNMGIIHSDIKPENLLFESQELLEVPFYRIDGKKDYYSLPSTPKIKLIDFGNAIKREHIHPLIITTRNYRSPEVLLEIPWSFETDIWSVGCVLVELYLGRPIFSSVPMLFNEFEKDLEQLNTFQMVLGPIPQSMISTEKEYLFNGSYQSRLVPISPCIGKFFKIETNRNGDEKFVLKKYKPTQVERLSDLIGHDSTFYDLISRTLNYLPHRRIRPLQALDHPFFDDLEGF